ncbi:MAG: RpiB/LacA/LacB family sugar-phosphate isomerase [Dehalococcoidales bacterium]|nr:MAG: RpiB/LacA/LacB family sugar-phosphate isomerase [Dehalococcoidales bacterium]
MRPSEGSKLRVVFGADHGGFYLKKEMTARLKGNYEILDIGAVSFEPDDDYPDFVVPVAETVVSGRAQRGIIICGSGVGACIVANKIPGIRAAICHDMYSAHQGVEHDDMNVLCLGARVIGTELATELVIAFLEARFSGEERHRRRFEKTLAIEKQALSGGGGKKEGV